MTTDISPDAVERLAARFDAWANDDTDKFTVAATLRAQAARIAAQAARIAAQDALLRETVGLLRMWAEQCDGCFCGPDMDELTAHADKLEGGAG